MNVWWSYAIIITGTCGCIGIYAEIAFPCFSWQSDFTLSISVKFCCPSAASVCFGEGSVCTVCPSSVPKTVLHLAIDTAKHPNWILYIYIYINIYYIYIYINIYYYNWISLNVAPSIAFLARPPGSPGIASSPPPKQGILRHLIQPGPSFCQRLRWLVWLVHLSFLLETRTHATSSMGVNQSNIIIHLIYDSKLQAKRVKAHQLTSNQSVRNFRTPFFCEHDGIELQLQSRWCF